MCYVLKFRRSVIFLTTLYTKAGLGWPFDSARLVSSSRFCGFAFGSTRAVAQFRQLGQQDRGLERFGDVIIHSGGEIVLAHATVMQSQQSEPRRMPE